MIHCTCTVDTVFIEDLILHAIIPEKGSSSIIRKLTMDVLFLCHRWSAQRWELFFVFLFFCLINVHTVYIEINLAWHKFICTILLFWKAESPTCKLQSKTCLQVHQLIRLALYYNQWGICTCTCTVEIWSVKPYRCKSTLIIPW